MSPIGCSIQGDRASAIRQRGVSGGKCVAVMQPYFFPYAGYFRLLDIVDHFVVFDCVQFPRRGRVHRTQVPGSAGSAEWLTLPLASMPREGLIRDLAFAPDARARFDDRLSRHAWLTTAEGAIAERLRAHLHGRLAAVIAYLLAGPPPGADSLGLPPAFPRSSDLAPPPPLPPHDRAVAALTAVG